MRQTVETQGRQKPILVRADDASTERTWEYRRVREACVFSALMTYPTFSDDPCKAKSRETEIQVTISNFHEKPPPGQVAETLRLLADYIAEELELESAVKTNREAEDLPF